MRPRLDLNQEPFGVPYVSLYSGKPLGLITAERANRLRHGDAVNYSVLD